MLEDVIWCNQFNTGLFKRMTDDLTADNWRAQPNGLLNHAAWQIGHVTGARANVAMLLGSPGPVSAADIKARFGTGTNPEPASIGGADKDQMLEQFWAAQRHIAELLPRANSDTLAAPTPNENMRRLVPTVGDAVRLLLTSHDALHIGQLSVWRRVLGLPRVLV